MGGEHGPVVVYGFVTDIIIQDTDFEKVLEKMNKYKEENHKGISDIEKFAKEKGKKYNRKYECKWQLALCGELEYNNFVNEDRLQEDIIEEMSYDSD